MSRSKLLLLVALYAVLVVLLGFPAATVITIVIAAVLVALRVFLMVSGCIEDDRVEQPRQG